MHTHGPAMACLRSQSADFTWGRKLGSGSFGVVYEVTRHADALTYAIKQMELKGMNQREQSDVVKEVQLLASFDSPYIIKYFDSFIDQSVLCLVMEFAARGNLHDYIRNNKAGRVAEPTVWRFFLQVLLGVHCMHVKHRTLHRDIKTLNIFLVDATSNGQGDGDGDASRLIAKLGDLGVAKILSTQTNFAHTLVGTPYYLSPEMCEDKPYNAKSDVWATGVVLYELLTRKHPFSGDNQGALILNILRGRYPPPPSGYGAEVVDAVKRCLTRDAKRRPTTTQLLATRGVRAAAEKLGIDVPSLDELRKAEDDLALPMAEKRRTTKAKKATSEDKTPARVRAKKNVARTGADGAAPSSAPQRKAKGQLLLGEKGKPKKLAPVGSRPRSSRAAPEESKQDGVHDPGDEQESHTDAGNNSAEPVADQAEPVSNENVSPDRASMVAAAAQAAASAPGHSGTGGVSISGKLAFEFGVSLHLGDTDPPKEPEVESTVEPPATEVPPAPAPGEVDNAIEEEENTVDEEDNYEDDEFEEEEEEGGDDGADTPAEKKPDVGALTRRMQSLTDGLKGVVTSASELVGEDQYAALHDLFANRASGEPLPAVSGAAPPSIADLSKQVFDIIPYAKAEAVQLVFKALYLESELADVNREHENLLSS